MGIVTQKIIREKALEVRNAASRMVEAAFQSAKDDENFGMDWAFVPLFNCYVKEIEQQVIELQDITRGYPLPSHDSQLMVSALLVCEDMQQAPKQMSTRKAIMIGELIVSACESIAKWTDF